MKKSTKIWLVLLLVVAVAAAYGLYLYNKKPADIKAAAAETTLSAGDLVATFDKDETVANSKYVDKVIAVTGNVADVKTEETGSVSVFLDSGNPLASVTCNFYDDASLPAKALQKGSTVTIKGLCVGKLVDVVLNKCSIVKE